MQVGKRLRSLFEHRPPILGHEVLRKIGHRAVLGHTDVSARGLTYACQNLQQGTLSGTILPHEGDAVFLVNLETDVTEQGSSAELYGKSFY